MQSLPESSEITYVKQEAYLRPFQHDTNQSGYGPVGYVGYATDLQQPRSTHQILPSAQSKAQMSHLHDYAVPLSPCDSNSSGEAAKEVLFRPIAFENNAEGTPLAPLTPPDSVDSSTRRDEEDAPDTLLVRIPRHQPTVQDAKPATEDKSPSEVVSLPPTHGITVNLLDKELWKMFMSVGNEMIVTKPGRRLFPALLVGLRGLDLQEEYSISLRVASADPYRYKFLNMRWVAVGESEVMQNEDRQIFCHPNSPNCGKFWMKKPISFKQMKITHNPSSSSGNVLLHTMHKYRMEVVLQPTGQPEIVIPIPDTDFVAVTAYQNTKITQLKIDNNPFAKGFRDRENAGFYHPSTLFTSPLPLPSLYSSPTGQSPVWHQMPQLACRIPPLPTSSLDMYRSRSTSPDESYQRQSEDLPPLRSYPQPSLPAPYPYFPPTSWPSHYTQPTGFYPES